MTAVADIDTCPFCPRPMGGKAKKIYGHSVCRKCFYAFANRRQLAFILDRFAWVLPSLVFGYIVGFIIAATGHTLTADEAEAINLMSWPLYIVFLFKDGFSGYSPGKWLCGVRTIDRITRQPAGFAASLKRNLPLYIPFVPLIVAFQLQGGKRLGDGWAKTMVIWKKFESSYVFGAQGLCEACSYDLRGNTSGICPECGAALSAANRRLFESGVGIGAADGRTTPPTSAT